MRLAVESSKGAKLISCLIAGLGWKNLYSGLGRALKS
jgi:hypothetical protein